MGVLLVVALSGCAVSEAEPAVTPPPSTPVSVAPPPFAELSEGMSNAEVAEVQRSLQQAGYQARRVDGQFDTETKHAVIAFQKVHGLPRTGVVDRATHDAIENPVTVQPRGNRDGFEVDLAKQVSYLVRDRVVQRIFDVSTGRAEEGKETPVGDFSVQYQINGWRHARLGPMWRPSYINSTGIALHGGEPVETSPASNGCIRMTDPTIDEIFPLLRPGTPVSVY